MLTGMSPRTVNWATLRVPGDSAADEGLRQRKKREMRQELSDTATEMFLERGFDQVRVADVAQACGVSEKTVFNYFPTKEALVLDLGEATSASLRIALADPELTPVTGALKVLRLELDSIVSWLAGQEDAAEARAAFTRFGIMIRSTPSLRAYQRDTADVLIATAAEVLARRFGRRPTDPEPQIAATALIGLWPLQFRALGRCLTSGEPTERLPHLVSAEVARAGALLDGGLHALGSARLPS